MTTKRSKHQLSKKHHQQVIKRSHSVVEAMSSLLALTWRPGDQSGSFLSKMFRPLGSPLMVVQHSGLVEDMRHNEGRGKRKAIKREQIALFGYKSEIDPSTGDVYFGGPQRNVFAYDFGLTPHVGASSRILDPKRNPSMTQLGLELDAIRQKYAERSFLPAERPRMPRIFLGFQSNKLPPFEDSPMLRHRAARRLRKSVQEINAMPDDAREKVLRQEWKKAFVHPGRGDNTTHLCLINQEMCNRIRMSILTYENFSELCGAELHNPVQDLISPQAAIENPTFKVANKLKIDVHKAVNGDRERDAEDGQKLEQGVKEALGHRAMLCSMDDIVHMLQNPRQQIVPAGANDIASLPDRVVIELMREAADHFGECCTDAALLQAAHNPNEKLFAAGVCNAQIIRFDPMHRQDQLIFDATVMRREHTYADFVSVSPKWANDWRW